ncbi:hypothetical protein BV97_04036 [Novosphingobium resinovorum]|uniref:Uncharacterized protein n=1 Tax=Novosphingobium resinovorum TaxID=158500 RepID=A0A031JR54_9SPHN|nr:hypothetical protein BV97_04036 [Novosphingobium resinovorum]
MRMLAILRYWAIDAFSVVWTFILSGMTMNDQKPPKQPSSGRRKAAHKRAALILSCNAVL